MYNVYNTDAEIVDHPDINFWPELDENGDLTYLADIVYGEIALGTHTVSFTFTDATTGQAGEKAELFFEVQSVSQWSAENKSSIGDSGSYKPTFSSSGSCEAETDGDVEKDKTDQKSVVQRPVTALDYDEVMEQYMEGLYTVENVLEAYGGQAKPENSPEIDTSGKFTIKFARPLVIPTSLLFVYDSEYKEEVPEIELTAA